MYSNNEMLFFVLCFNKYDNWYKYIFFFVCCVRKGNDKMVFLGDSSEEEDDSYFDCVINVFYDEVIVREECGLY